MRAAIYGGPRSIEIGERPVGYVVPRPEHRGTLTESEILDFLSTRFERWWLPDEIRFIDEVPKTSVGKFAKTRMRDAYANGEYEIIKLA